MAFKVLYIVHVHVCGLAGLLTDVEKPSFTLPVKVFHSLTFSFSYDRSLILVVNFFI